MKQITSAFIRFVLVAELAAFAEQAEVCKSRNKVPGLFEYHRTHRDQNVGIRKMDTPPRTHK